MYENSRLNWQLFLRQICSSHSKAPHKTLHQLSTLRGNTNSFMSLEPSAYSEQALTLQSCYQIDSQTLQRSCCMSIKRFCQILSSSKDYPKRCKQLISAQPRKPAQLGLDDPCGSLPTQPIFSFYVVQTHSSEDQLALCPTLNGDGCAVVFGIIWNSLKNWAIFNFL